jgi:hypothetical protein
VLNFLRKGRENEKAGIEIIILSKLLTNDNTEYCTARQHNRVDLKAETEHQM